MYKTTFILPVVEFDGEREFCPKIACFIQIIVEGIGDAGHKFHMEEDINE